MRLISIPLLLAPLFCFLTSFAIAAPDSFSQAKRLLRDHVYFDQNQTRGTFYCGCTFSWVGKSGGRTNLESCGFNVTKMPERAARIEWEHVVPASSGGRHMACWREGGRSNCQSTSESFNRMEADMFNLVPSVGSVNAMRSNNNYGMVAGGYEDLGACPTKVGNTDRIFEPRDEVKGAAARVTFYMSDRYNIRLSRGQQAVLKAWDRQYPVTSWELERNRRISRAMGHTNPFVTGELRWTQGYQPRGEGVLPPAMPIEMQASRSGRDTVQGDQHVIGNRRSKVYHLAEGCPSYSRVGQSNRVPFSTEEAAISAGYRKAGNCR